MSWTIQVHEDFDREFQGFDDRVQDEILAKLIVLEKEGPNLGRPHADTLNGSAHSNMKELRVSAAGGIWCIAFAFAPGRNAILWRLATSVAPMRTVSIVTWSGSP